MEGGSDEKDGNSHRNLRGGVVLVVAMIMMMDAACDPLPRTLVVFMAILYGTPSTYDIIVTSRKMDA